MLGGTKCVQCVLCLQGGDKKGGNQKTQQPQSEQPRSQVTAADAAELATDFDNSLQTK